MQVKVAFDPRGMKFVLLSEVITSSVAIIIGVSYITSIIHLLPCVGWKNTQHRNTAGTNMLENKS